MKPQEFQQYLEQPGLLYQLPLTSLQQLAMEYPYSPNLRLLLLLKTHLEGHPDEADYLSRCSAASFDRSFIYDLLQDIELQPAGGNQEDTEILELRTLDEIALEEAAMLAEDASTSSPETEPSYQSVFPPLEDFVEEPDLPLEPKVVPVPPSPVDTYHSWADNAAAYLSALPEQPADPTVSQSPEPVTNFRNAALTKKAPSLRERLLTIRRFQADKIADEQEEVKKIARRSLVAQEAVASETLAKLLVRQGQYQNAIKMYQHLALLYPKKKTTFAGLIKDLKEKL
ncbi:hypothetical protein [Neolewinella persica]|uniref:hypothetical protein n=1 Tax=Neolewinella persica TaxID=70998 RepID=UPI0003A533CE|nr:hypothetical protein [Neolewinella persica]